MGDTGSLAIGGALGTVAILLKAEFLLLLIGGRVRGGGDLGDRCRRGTYKWFKRTRGRSTPTPTGSSGWRRCTTTSRSSAGPRPRW